MRNIKILVFDSGQGGLPYFQAIKTVLSSHNIAVTIDYLADNAAFPYGTKTNQELQERFHYIASTLSQLEDPYDLLIVACNTASLHGSSIFTQYISTKNVVFTTPTLALSSIENRTQEVFLLATSATCRFYNQDTTMGLIAADPLVAWIEEHWDSSTEKIRLAYLESFWLHHLASIKNSFIILGCTHFLHIKDHLERMHPEQNIQFIDTRDYVANETLNRVIAQKSHQSISKKSTIGTLFLTSDNKHDREHYISIIGEYHLEFSTKKLI
ncbi:aspartate/glutamate racemase family protein [Entomospira nematocerorum]|uniref:Glutamate racemase n=1 Tax=Entomospira nematocerorum TaxID=2719987 RepID=A0A968KT09_9SPIO|nr:aspartate/glutamate racemase family protein [Entomospira nematocera]NIZ47160.1 hypothetical protein [Entomospira nematocera]WDI34297.1 aspartate/glutamate racemase family protein [Entomospira nematocera]